MNILSGFVVDVVADDIYEEEWVVNEP